MTLSTAPSPDARRPSGDDGRGNHSSAWTLLVYLALGLAILGPVALRPTRTFIGWPGDPQQFMWYLGWLWHALLHGHSPFHTALLNAPVGQNLMWNTSVLTESLLFGPVALWLGGPFAYNLVWLLNFIAAGWTGEHILRLLGVRRRWLTLAGGVLVSIMPYSMAQSLYHLHLFITSIVLAMAWMLLRGYRRGVRRPLLFGATFGVLAAAQFYTAEEVFLSSLLTGVLLLTIWAVVRNRNCLDDLRQLPQRASLSMNGCVVLVVSAIVTLAALVAPGLWQQLRGPDLPHGALLPAWEYASDLLNFTLPTPIYWLHAAWTNRVSFHYSGNFWESDAYLSVPGILFLFWAGWRLWSVAAARVLVYTMVILSLLSMGPLLRINGHALPVILPWAIVARAPYLDSMLPSRLMLYADILAILLLLSAFQAQLDSLPARRQTRIPARRRQARRHLPPSLWPALTACALALVTACWLPRIPFYHTATPVVDHALLRPSPLLPLLARQPTYVLDWATPQVMAPLAAGGYPFPMVNAYGYTSNSPTRAAALRALKEVSLEVSSRGMPAANIPAILRANLPRVQATRVLYLPLPSQPGIPDWPLPGNHLNAAQLAAVSDVLGRPLAQADGAVVWNVPPSLR